jgi:hypothetical protein
LIRGDIRGEIAKQDDVTTGGGDFYGPFWADAKGHVGQRCELINQTKARIASNSGRSRLYPQLRDGFLTWWNDRRRWTNEDLHFFENSVKGRYEFADLGAVIKVENLLSVRLGGGGERLIYPYFSEKPALTEEGGRLGLWLMAEALPGKAVDDLRILDVIRATAYSVDRYPLLGNEEAIFRARYAAILTEWQELWEEYY